VNSKKLAEITGFSRSTISKVVNGYSDISEETRKKVLAAIEKYKYFPNKSAQKLAGKTSRIIGLLVYTGQSSNDDKKHKKIEESLYYSELISKIVDAAEARGYFVLVSYIDKNGATWEEIFSNGVIDGAIVITGGKGYKEIELLVKSGNNIVLLDYEKDIENANAITINPSHFNGGYIATDHLIKNGHKKILHLTGELRRKTSIERAKGYKKCLEDYGIKESHIIPGRFSKENAFRIIDLYIQKHKTFDYTGIFAGNDYIAFGAIEALKKHGISVPEDVSIVGYDNMELCNYSTPKITSINHLDLNIAEKAIDNLIKMISGRRQKKKRSCIRIIQRESVKKIK
jgi:LacI family transcriptional regulator